MSDSLTLKTEALCWLRFGKKMEYVATEAGDWNADVLGINEKFSVEVEVKMSKADLHRDFTNKKAKHYLYSNAGGGPSRAVPNYFYFYVPEELKEYALGALEKEAPKAGLAVHSGSDFGRDGDRTYIAKKPSRLHDKIPSPAFTRKVLLRMGSELCGRYIVHKGMVERANKELERYNNTIIDVFKKMRETPDFEVEDVNTTSSP